RSRPARRRVRRCALGFNQLSRIYGAQIKPKPTDCNPWASHRSTTHAFLHLGVTREGVVQRREFLKCLGVGLGAGALSLGWRDLVMASADQLRRQGKSMILLWMDGGPCQFNTFNPKVGSENQGPTKAISTKLPGIEFAEY